MSSTRARVLIAEDNPETLALLNAYLHGRSYSFELASTGREALSRYHSAQQIGEPYHLLVFDVALPMMTGTSVLKEIRAEGDAKTRAVLLTALSPDDLEKENLSAAGVFDIWHKPNAFGNLNERILNALAGRRSPRTMGD